MKIKSLEIENIGIIVKETIIFNEPLMLFIGKIKQGKTTILNCVKYVLGAKFPDDILRHGTDRGHGLIKWDNSSIKRVFRRKKDGTITADKIEFILNGELQKKPTDAIKQFLNPFTLDQNFFSNMKELERNRYFVELFGVDTSEEDKDINTADEAAKLLRATIKVYGEIDITPVEKADVYALKKSRQKILDEYKTKKDDIDFKNNITKQQNDAIDEHTVLLKDLNNQLEQVKRDIVICLDWLDDNKKEDLLPEIPLPNIEKIDTEISEAKATNVKHERYLENKKRYDEKQSKNLELSEQETQLRELRAGKIKQLASISDKCGVPGLTFNENAIARYEGSTLGMISGSQEMKLSSALQRLYPEGFGIELIDGFESSGAIYGNEFGEPVNFYINKAKREETTILATVVGEKPAEIPEDVGVWIVEEGKLI